MAQVKLSDVAHLAQVSLSAAGKVLNGGSNQIRVGAETRKRILAAAQELGYHRNVAASVLRGGESKLLGVIADTHAHYRTAAVVRAVEQAAAARGLRLMTSSSHDNVRNLVDNYHDLRQHFSARVLMLAHDYPGEESTIAEAFGNESEVVFLEPPCFEGARWVSMRNSAALKALLRRYHAAGLRRFGIMHGSTAYGYNRRLVEDFDAALRGVGLEPDEQWHYPVSGELPVREMCRSIVAGFERDAAPELIFVDKAEHAVALQSHLQSCGWRIPGQLIFVGGDNDPLYGFMSPEIASFNPRYAEIAEAMLDTLLEPDRVPPTCIIEAEYNTSQPDK